MQDKTVVITGANSGIGAAATRALTMRGATVVMLCRNQRRSEEAIDRIKGEVPNAQIHLYICDLASFASVRTAAQAILDAHPKIHILVNNAGLYMPRRRETEDGLETTLQVNHFGPFLLTQLLLERLVASAPARVINVSSEAHRIGRIRFEERRTTDSYKGFEAYGTSKLMNILHARALSNRFDPATLTAYSVHPGAVATGFAQDEKCLFGTMVRLFSPLMRSPAKGAQTVVYLCTAPDNQGEKAPTNGAYFIDEQERTPSTAAHDSEAMEQLWMESMRITSAPPIPAVPTHSSSPPLV